MTSSGSDSVLRMRKSSLDESLDTAIAVGEVVSEGTDSQNADLEPSIPHTRHGNDCLFNSGRCTLDISILR